MSFEEPTVTVYISRRVNLGDYDSIDIFAKWEKVPITAGEGFKELALKTTDAVVNDLIATINVKADAVRKDEKARKRKDGPITYQDER